MAPVRKCKRCLFNIYDENVRRTKTYNARAPARRSVRHHPPLRLLRIVAY